MLQEEKRCKRELESQARPLRATGDLEPSRSAASEAEKWVVVSSMLLTIETYCKHVPRTSFLSIPECYEEEREVRRGVIRRAQPSVSDHTIMGAPAFCLIGRRPATIAILSACSKAPTKSLRSTPHFW